MMWRREWKRKREGYMRRKKLNQNSERKRKKCTMSTNIMWKRMKKTDTKVERAGRENMKQKLTGTRAKCIALFFSCTDISYK